VKTSKILTTGEIYTRKQLQKKFNITDATINTGIFRPIGHDSVWLFVTQHKTADRTQYTDYFSDENTLHWDGQTAGRKDDLIINHKQQRLELLLFFRERKNEHPGYGFRNEGSFEYVSHTLNIRSF